MKAKKFLYILLSVCLLFGLSSCRKGTAKQPFASDEFPVDENTTTAENRFEVHFIDVGQGDAALVLCDAEAMLIDGGKPQASSIIYTYLKKLNIEKLNYIVCSHADDDHIGGLSAPLAKMTVENILAPETPADTRAYRSITEKAAEQEITIRHPKCGESMDFASSKINFYGPVTESADDRNNGSIVMKVIYGETSFLFTGDAERIEEQQILDAGYDISATVLKVGHHGSKNSATYPFLREVMPKYAVISVGKNSYGHPTEDTLSRLRDADVKVYRTDMQGDIIAVSDGKTVSFTTSKNENVQTNPTAEARTELSAAEPIAETTTPPLAETHEYICNDNTKKFHYANCRAVSKMSEENKIHLNCTRDEAIAKGYEACKICKP